MAILNYAVPFTFYVNIAYICAYPTPSGGKTTHFEGFGVLLCMWIKVYVDPSEIVYGIYALNY